MGMWSKKGGNNPTEDKNQGRIVLLRTENSRVSETSVGETECRDTKKKQKQSYIQISRNKTEIRTIRIKEMLSQSKRETVSAG